jgi:hypothetical protein
MANAKLRLEIVTESKELATICALYLEIDENLNLVHKVGELSQRANMITSVIREACRSHIHWHETAACSLCSRPGPETHRLAYLSNAIKEVILMLIKRVPYTTLGLIC